MTLTDLEALKDYILAQNTYFQTGWANAFKVRNVGSNNNGLVMARTKSGDLIPVSPQDTWGNYFYMRNETGIVYRAAGALTNKITIYEQSLNISLVAYLKEGDMMKINNNLINTLMKYNNCLDRTAPIQTIWNREQVIIEELSGLRDDDIAATLQRLKDWVIVKLNFVFQSIYTPNLCIEDICADC